MSNAYFVEWLNGRRLKLSETGTYQGLLTYDINDLGSKLIHMTAPATDMREKSRKSPQSGVIPGQGI